MDPGDDASPAVFQLETAMGAAIESFKGAGAVVVDRSRFVPVKTYRHWRACVHTYMHTHTHTHTRTHTHTHTRTHTHRFAPVKTCADLLRVRSDAYEVTDDFRLVLSPDCKGSPPVVDLDKKVYKKVAGLEKMLEKGELPSLKHCSKLAVKGKVVLSPGTVFKGKVSVVNAGDDWKELPAGTYEDQDISL